MKKQTSKPEYMIICGLLIHSVPGTTENLIAELCQMPGTEVHHRTEDGRLIVTVESDDKTQAGDVLIQMQSLPGVAAASLVYHHFEDLDAAEREPAQLQEM